MVLLVDLLIIRGGGSVIASPTPQDQQVNQTQTMNKDFFTENEWDMIYNFIGHALDDEDYDPEDVYAIRAKIHNLFL